MSQKSAKDLAFDKERSKFRKQIRELESEIRKRDITIMEANCRADDAENKCRELQDWVNRLLEYTELSEDDMKKIIEKEKLMNGVSEHVAALFGIPARFFG